MRWRTNKCLYGAPNHKSGHLVVPKNIMLHVLPLYSPELNPKENLWDEIREKIFKNYALKSIDAVRHKAAEPLGEKPSRRSRPIWRDARRADDTQSKNLFDHPNLGK